MWDTRGGHEGIQSNPVVRGILGTYDIRGAAGRVDTIISLNSLDKTLQSIVDKTAQLGSIIQFFQVIHDGLVTHRRQEIIGWLSRAWFLLGISRMDGGYSQPASGTVDSLLMYSFLFLEHLCSDILPAEYGDGGEGSHGDTFASLVKDIFLLLDPDRSITRSIRPYQFTAVSQAAILIH